MWSTPLVLIPLFIIDLLTKSVTSIVVTFAVSFMLLSVWYPYLRLTKVPVIQKSATNLRSRNKFLGVLQLIVFMLIIVAIFYSNEFLLSKEFYALLAILYGSLFFEAFYFKANIFAYIIKLLIAQLLSIETFAFRFQSVFTFDSFRDLYLTHLILANAGGLPQAWTTTIWYNFTPMAPISYAIQSLIGNLPPIQVETVSGFTVVFVSVLVVGSIAFRIFKDDQICLLSMFLASLIPFIWLFATLPLPEMFAMPLALIAILFALGQQSLKSFVASAISGCTVILTHGGLGIELIGILVLIYLFSRNRLAANSAIVLSCVYVVYSFYVIVGNTLSGASTIAFYIRSILTPAPQFISTLASKTNLVSQLSTLYQTLTQTYWWVLLSVLTWVGFVELLAHRSRYSKAYLGLLIATIVLFLAGMFFTIQPVFTSEAKRYVGLVSYLVICIPASSSLVMLSLNAKVRRFLVPLMMTLLIVASVSSPLVSPTLWQDFGANSTAGFRLVNSVTSSEMISQLYLNRYDYCYPVSANYVPEFVNLTPSCSDLLRYHVTSETFYNLIGVAGSTSTNINHEDIYPPLSPPYVVLFSTRIATYSPSLYGAANPQSNITIQDSDVIYSNSLSLISFVFPN